MKFSSNHCHCFVCLPGYFHTSFNTESCNTCSACIMKGALWQLSMLVIRPLSKHLFLFVIMGKMKKTIPRLAFASFCPKIMSIYIHQSLIGSIFCCICNNIIYILTEKYIHLCLYYTWANEMKEKKSWNGLWTARTEFLRCLLLVLPGSCMLYWYFSFIGRYHFTAFTCICSHFIGYC